MKEKPISLYEVIRVIDHIPLFLEDHLDRLYNTAKLNHISNLPKTHEIQKKISDLIQGENRKMGNLKLTFTSLAPEIPPQMELDFIAHFYPPEEKYHTGVKVGILYVERPNPQAKIQNMELRNKANLVMSKEMVYEVLLVDQEGNIREGSRSNVFFVSDGQLFTAPDEKVLKGITRKKVLQICKENKIKVTLKDIPLNELSGYDGAFLTGSSPKVLPINSVGEINFNAELPLIQRIINLYEKMIVHYLTAQQQDLNEIN